MGGQVARTERRIIHRAVPSSSQAGLGSSRLGTDVARAEWASSLLKDVLIKAQLNLTTLPFLSHPPTCSGIGPRK